MGDDATIRDHLGDVYCQKGMKEKALIEWKRSFELDNTQKEVENKIKQAEQELCKDPQ